MTAVLLSAGIAYRLGDISKERPKCLAPLVNGDTVLDVQLRHIIDAGIHKVVISAGHKVEMIERHVKRYRDDAEIKVVFNPFFDVSNNLVSLWNVRYELAGGEMIIINGDNLFEKWLLEKLLASSEDACMLINSKEHYDDDDMKVVLSDGYVTAVSKSITHKVADGESVGIMRFRNKAKTALLNKLDEMVRDKANLSVYYLKAVQEIIDDGIKVHVQDIRGHSWAEIDYPEDYEIAIKRYRDFLK